MKKFNMHEIMVAAWKNFRKELGNFSACLKMAWAAAKKAVAGMTKEEKIEKLIAAGAKRWTLKNMDRLYINASALGYKWSCYKTGNISASFAPDGAAISHAKMSNILNGKIFLDINDDFAIKNSTKCEDAYIEDFVKNALA